MTKRTKKDLIYFLIGLFIASVFLFFIFDIMIEGLLDDYDTQNISFREKIRIVMAIDDCLDIGRCKEGLHLKDMAGKSYILNKDSCTKNNGKWIEEYKVCDFRHRDHERKN